MPGLTGEADDDVGAHPGQRRVATDLLEQPEEALGVAEAPHPPQHGGAGVLEGEVEVGRDARRGRDRLHQARSGLGRLEVGDPHPVDALDGRDLRQQRLQQAQVAEVLAVGRGVLRDQEQLARALGGQPGGVVQHVAGPAAHEAAAEGRDGAERAPTVTAAGQLQRRHRTAVEATPHAALRGGGGAVDGADREQPTSVGGRVGLVGVPGHDGAQPRRDVGVVVEAEDGVGLGQRRRQLGAVALGQAAYGHDGARPSLALEVRGLQQRVHAVLLGALDEAAGVDHDGVGQRRITDQAEAVTGQSTGELLGVDLVAGAAQRQHGHREWLAVHGVDDRGRVGMRAHQVSMPLPP